VHSVPLTDVLHSTEVRTVAVNDSSSVHVVNFYCNMFRLMYQEPSSG